MKNAIDQYALRIPFGSNPVDIFKQYAAKPTDFCEKFKEEDNLMANIDLTDFEKTTPKTMSRKIQIQLQRSQMEILAGAVSSITRDDLMVHGDQIGIMMEYFITRIRERVLSRLENRETNKRKFKLSFLPAEAAALEKTFSKIQFNSATEAQLLRTVLMELDRHM